MKDQTQMGTSRALNRPEYAQRFVGCIAALIGYGFIIGLALRSSMASDPMGALQQLLVLATIGNVIVGGFFVAFTYRRALDCKFGRNGKAWIAAVAALPTLILPQYGLLVFAGMMFFKSDFGLEETPEIADDSGILRPLEAGK